MPVVRELLTERGRPLVMGILNVTPDSFYADSRRPDPSAALAAATRMANDGADILDVGGESTRPGSEPVDEAEELRRVIPVVEAIAAELSVPISVDTRRASVAEAALAAGATIVNDVSAGRDDERLFEVVRKADADIVLMHMQGYPRDMQREPQYHDVVSEVAGFLLQRCASATWKDVPRDAIVIDPGIGFGKSLAHNLQLLAATDTLSKLGYPLLVGCSRKSMFQALLGRAVDERLPGSLAVAACAVADGASLLRVHDVAATLDVVKTVQAIGGAR